MYTHTTECYLELKNEILVYAMAWVDLEKSMLRERSQSQKSMYYMVTFV
jgi:hypothetical protein